MQSGIITAIGLMSGTSLDGIDAALIETDGQDYVKILADYFFAYDENLKSGLRNAIVYFSNVSSNLKYCDILALEKSITVLHAEAVAGLLKKAQISLDKIRIIGFHGQTIIHRPDEGITLQIGNPHLLARLTGIDVVSDFRRKDMVYGGQGAPLVPIYHKALMNEFIKPIIVVNIGGVANLTYIDDENLIAFDVGSGNALIDDYVKQNLALNYDKDGNLASQGKVNISLVNKWLDDEYFNLLPPKSLDRNHFHYILEQLSLTKNNHQVSHNFHYNNIASLSYFTAAVIDKAIKFLPKTPVEICVCGGGRHNKFILKNLANLSNIKTSNIDDLSINGDMVEAEAFAYIAARTLQNKPSSFPSTTGVFSPVVSGVIHPK